MRSAIELHLSYSGHWTLDKYANDFNGDNISKRYVHSGDVGRAQIAEDNQQIDEDKRHAFDIPVVGPPINIKVMTFQRVMICTAQRFSGATEGQETVVVPRDEGDMAAFLQKSIDDGYIISGMAPAGLHGGKHHGLRDAMSFLGRRGPELESEVWFESLDVF